MSEESIKSKTIKGTFWSAADAFLGQGITFIVGIVLARLLSPEEYGLIGICLVVNSVLNGIVDGGLSKALIRKRKVSHEDYNTMFITNMLMSIVIYYLLYVASPWIAVFFSRTELIKLIRVAGLLLIINAFSIVQLTILAKRLDFKTRTKASLISAFISGIIGIVMAIYNMGVWALIGQLLSKQILYVASLWILNQWYPKLRFSIESFLDMWKFGWKLLLSGILDSLWNQLYQIIVGKYYSPATLGQYTKSNEYSSILSSNFTSIVQRVTYPVLSEIQDDKVRMREAYRKIIKITMFITAVCMVSLAAVSEPFIYTMIGTKWCEAASFLPFISISMSLYPLHAINLNILQVLGRSDIFLYLEIIKKILGIVPILIGIFIDIYWMLTFSFIMGIFCLYLNSWYTGKAIGYTFSRQLKDVFPSYIIAFTIALSVYFLKYLSLPYFTILIIQVIVGVIVGVVICEFLKYAEYVELKSIAIKLINVIFRKNDR